MGMAMREATKTSFIKSLENKTSRLNIDALNTFLMPFFYLPGVSPLTRNSPGHPTKKNHSSAAVVGVITNN
jgi:hypothetical protein